MCSCLRHEAVTAEVESVSQSSGRPMSAATKNGLRSALGDPSGPSVVIVTARRPGDLRAASPIGAALESVVFGVGHSAAASSRFRFPCSIRSAAVSADGIPRRLSPSAAVGVGVGQADASPGKVNTREPSRFWYCQPVESTVVGVIHIFTCVLSEVISDLPNDSFFAIAASTDRCSSRAAGVPHEPEPRAEVRGANGCRAEQTPFRIEPELGKVVEDMGEPESNKLGDVLQQDESGSQVSDDGCDGWPEPALIVSSTLLPSRAERLARETGSDEIHSATPRAAVEGGEVIPDRSLIQTRLRHPLHENGRCVGVPLNVSHGSYPCHGSEGELESSVAGAEVDGR